MDYQEHYKIDAELFDYFADDQLGINEERRNQTIFDLCNYKGNDDILEIGSGRGWFSIRMADKNVNVTSLDLSEKNLNQIKKINPKINTVLGDANNLPFENEKFDWIVANEVLEHLENPEAAILEWKRCLKPQGKILLSVPFREKIRYSLCIYCNKKTPLNAHLHSFNEMKLAEIFKRCDMKIVKTEYYMNKFITLFRLNKYLKILPFKYWKKIDNILNNLNLKPALISFVLGKK